MNLSNNNVFGLVRNPLTDHMSYSVFVSVEYALAGVSKHVWLSGEFSHYLSHAYFVGHFSVIDLFIVLK